MIHRPHYGREKKYIVVMTGKSSFYTYRENIPKIAFQIKSLILKL